MKQVAICMSTYNGEQYIREQIESILRQSYSCFRIFIRDDGSTDGTIDIIREYCKNHSNIILINENHFENIGVRDSFLQIIDHVFSSYSDVDYYAFADQDDVWLEDKVKKAVEKLESIPANRTGKLYYSNKTIVDENLNKLYDEKIHYYGDFLDCLYTSLAYGCTMMFDKKFARLLCRHKPRLKCYHDSWIYRLAFALDSSVVFDKRSYILYRQHSSNQTGIGEKKNFAYYIKVIGNIHRNQKEHFLSTMFREIKEYYPKEIRYSKNYDMIKSLLLYKHSLYHTRRLLHIYGLSKRRLITRLSWYGKVIIRMI